MRDACHHRLSEWQQNLPKELVYQSNSKNLYAMCLQITFLAQLLLLNRPVIYTDHTLLETIRKPSETIAGNAADAITKITDDLVKMWGPRYMSQHSMSCMFAAMTVQMLKRRSSNPKTSSDADRKLQTNMAKLLEMDKILPMAGWIHRRYSRILEGEGDEARTISISPPAVETSFSATHSMLPSQRTPTLAPQMRTIAEEGTKQEAEDSWSNETVLHLEHTLTAPSTHHEHHLSANNNGIGNSSGGSNGVQQERQGYAEMMQESQVGTSPIHPEIFDYHWFMENIGDIGNPFFWNPPQEQVQ